jgi:hypothetical protein
MQTDIEPEVMTPLPQTDREDDWRHLSLQQLRDEMVGEHNRMRGYVQGLVDANAATVKILVDTLSQKFVTAKELEHEVSEIELKYGWIPALLKWVGIGLGGGMLAAWLKQILK